ncbi:hypothetical protein [Vescimonas sp.]|jgi:hypothetical protein|uniref:hypothetical protein n=1 Tax=Vescimonas sp. TaxID=2892404 RepID=UPI00307CBD29
MNRVHFDQIIDNYAAQFAELNTGKKDEVYKWEIAAEFRPMMDAALAADERDFPAKLAAVVLLTKQTIDNGAELAFHALADYARSEPQAVRNALHQLLTPDGGDLEARTQCFTEFLNFCESMRSKYYPDSWRYRASIRLPMMITGFYDPDHYYMYKASQAQAYADCVEFYDDWGSGAKMDLRIYHRMCDELIEIIKLHPKFKMIRDTRKNYAKKPLHPDTELHILAFDVIFCSTVYNLFEGIHYSVRNAEEKRIHLEKMNEAINARANHAEALDRMARLDYAEAFFAEKLSVGSAVTHKRFGVGTITGLSSKVIEAQFSGLDHPSTLVWRDCVKTGLLSFKTEENAAEYDELVTLIRRAEVIRKNAAIAEKKLEQYAEYLQFDE